jgi:cytoskeletal protein CcmA (bactofilin family)
MTVDLQGHVFNGAGVAINGATVEIFTVATGADESTSNVSATATTTTDSTGLWTSNDMAEGDYDVRITSGTEIRWLRHEDKISFQQLDVRNGAAAGTPAVIFSNTTNSASNQVAIFRGANTTRANNDEIYLSFELADSGGALDEFARITAVATDVTGGGEDGALVFYVADTDSSGDLQEAFRIASSTGGTISQTFTSDSITFGSGSDTDVVINFNANTYDGVLTWMEDEDYFKFSDDILLSTAEKLQLRDTAIYLYSSADGQADLVADSVIQVTAPTVNIEASTAITLESDSVTFGENGDTDIVLTFNANNADGVITWMEDEDYFKFSDDILMNSTERISFYDTAIYIYSSADGQLDLIADTEIQIAATTIDINGAVALNGAITGATDITLSGELDAASLDVEGNADINGILEADAYTVDGTTLAEYIADTAGAMFTSNTETGITATYQDGDNTVDLVVGTLNQDTTGTAAIATTVTITDNESTDEDNAIIFTAGGDVGGGNLGLESDGTLTYNPSSGTVTATIFVGNIDAVDGDFDGTLEADALTVGGTNVLTGGLITTLGTISAGVWNGTAITGAYINDDIVSGQSEITSGLATADELLYSDGGTVKRVGLDTLTTYLAGVNAGTVTSTGLSDSSGVITLDIQNMTASTTIADADLVVIDDGAGGTLRKMTRANFIESAALDAINIDGGAIDGAVIGANSAAAGTFAAVVGTSLDVNGAADISGDLTLSAGADGALRFSVASSIKILDNSATALVIEEADNAYITFVTTNSSEAITVAKATTFSAGIANAGTIAAGTWNGTAIATGYIAADAITGAKIVDDAIDSEHYTDGSIDFAHIQNVAANSVLGRNANSSGVLSEVALATTQILIGDGTGFTAAALSGDATMTNAGVVSLAGAQTGVTSLLATDIKIGEDAQTLIDFETANEIHFDADNAERVKIDSTGLTIVSGSIDLGGQGSSTGILNVGASGNDWDDTKLALTGSLRIRNTADESKSSVNINAINTQDITSATSIYEVPDFGALVLVGGREHSPGHAQKFLDLVWCSQATNPSVISAYTAGGSPAARTYTRSVNDLQLAMASDTYDVSVLVTQFNSPL